MNSLIQKVKQFFVVKQQHEKQPYFNLFALVNFVDDVFHLHEIDKVFLQLLPEVVRVLHIKLVLVMHAFSEDLHEFVEKDSELF